MSGGRLERWAAALVSRPLFYDAIQNLAGQAKVAARLRGALAGIGPIARVLDVGSADGGFAARLGVDPVFVDFDPRPLIALRRRRPDSRPVAADATLLPFRDGAFDTVLCVAVAHHLDDEQLERAVSELGRVAHRSLVFLDALRDDDRSTSRWLWRLDRGRNPRTAGELRRALERRFRLASEEEFTVYHRYVIWVGAPR